MTGCLLWQESAQCKGADSSLFEGKSKKREFKKYCNACPVKPECLEYALIYNMSGVWGGTTDEERRRVSRIKIQLLISDYEESGLYNEDLKVS